MSRRVSVCYLLLTLLVSLPASAELVRWEVTKREPYAGGKPRGDAGPYEQWTGAAYFAVDPNAAANEQIVDLKLAPRNAAGKVEFSADFRMLVPHDRSKANGALFYEVNNRGGATATRISRSDPTMPLVGSNSIQPAPGR